MKTKVLLFLFIFISLFSYSNEISSTNLIDPFQVYFENNCCHIISYFTNHDNYESIEAMIKDTDDIRVIITYKDKTQIDFINNQKVYLSMKDTSKYRKVIYTPIDCKINQKIKKPEVTISFVTDKNEKVFWFLKCASKPSKKYGGVVNPEGHSENTSFPIMSRDKSTLAGSETTLFINDIKMDIPVEIDKAPFFVGLKSYYSESFFMGIMRKSDDDIVIIQAPTNYAVGEKWIYEINGTNIAYEIVTKNNNSMTIKGNNCIINAVIQDKTISIGQIQYVTFEENSMFLRFTPAIPIFSTQKCESFFSIGFNKQRELVLGLISIDNNKNACRIELHPQKPIWSNNRIITITTKIENNTINRVLLVN